MTLWPAHIVSAASLVSTTNAIYVGRRPQEVGRRDMELWIERLPDLDPVGSGAHLVKRHAYRCHFRRMQNMGGDKVGQNQVGSVDTRLQDMVARYDGQVYFVADFPTMLPATAVEVVVDEDPEETRWILGAVDVTWHVAA
jgi:hypothetical protein